MKKCKLLFLLFGMMLLVSCGREPVGTEQMQDKLGENQIYAYYVNSDMTNVQTEIYSLDMDEDLETNVSKLLKGMARQEPTESYQSPIPEGISYIGNHMQDRNGRLEVSFGIVYDMVDADSFLFFKVCTVQTLLQLEGVNSVALSLTDLTNSNKDTATTIEIFDQDSFAMSFGDENGYSQKGAIVLYFANESGEQLREYRKSVEISNNMSLARIVVEALIQGPQREGYAATLPDTTTIRTVSVKDGVCYVDLSDEFYSTDNPLKNDVIIYSIVNSLAELPTVSKVQFLNNGEKQPFFRETLPFDGIFERNLDLVEEEDIQE